MDKDLHNIEDLFRSGLDENEEMPSAKVWHTVDQRLDKETVVTIKKKYKTLKRFSVLLLFLLIGLSIYEINTLFSNGGIEKTNETDSKKVNAPDNDGNKKRINKNNSASNEQIDSKAGTNRPPQKGNQFNTGNQDQKEFRADAGYSANNLSVAKIYQDVIKKTEKSVADHQNNNTNDLSGQADNPLSFQWQLNPLHAEKINRFSNDSAERKKLLQSLASVKDNPGISAKMVAPQQARKKPARPSPFSVIGFFSPDIASYHLDDVDTPNQPDNSEDIKRTERHEFSSTSGLLVEYAAGKQWTIQSGITFSNTNIAVEPKTIYAQTINNGDIKYRLNISSGYAYLVPSFQPVPALGDSLKVTAITHKLRYLGIPIAVKYSITSGKLKIEAMTGLTVNFLTMGKLETEIQKGPNNEIDILNKIEGLKPIYLSGQAGIGAEYKLAGKVSFILMPTARFALMPINKGGVVKTFPYSFGLASGLKLRL